MVAVDTYFSSVKYAKQLEDMGLVFNGAANKLSRQYPMLNIQRKKFFYRGYYYNLVLVDEGMSEIMEFEWVDRNRRCFIATRESLDEGQAVSRQRCLQVVYDVNEVT